MTKQKVENTINFDTISQDLKENLMLDCLKDDTMFGNPLNELDDEINSKISSKEHVAESSSHNEFDNVFNMSSNDNFFESPMVSLHTKQSMGRPKKLVKHARHYYKTFEYQCDDMFHHENQQEEHSIMPVSSVEPLKAPVINRSESPSINLESLVTVKKRDTKALAKIEQQSELDQEPNEVTVTQIDDITDMSQTQATSPEKKRRGRKRERDDLYCVEAEEKIQEIKKKLLTAKADGIPVKQRQRLRN